MKTLNSKSEYFNSLNSRDKETIKYFIVELGYTDVNMLSEHIIECGVAKRFSLTGGCLREVIAHYE
ncbi:Arn.1 conserved hypothetical protein [Escherichia phage vB_EcoM_VR7]|uniref:Uncharacterized protein arn.1 n=1 Tax=Escherichia phage vB_EcoM_VR7 TaxID=700939 RepID=E5FJ35_9CAUD|nr:anti-restriction nuclease [Escherichia phage vB_EcoM_VR7]ADR32646.1 Arn.1 conserved hypothetical protein [Escherichia phage vB_EcoM_VR7]